MLISPEVFGIDSLHSESETRGHDGKAPAGSFLNKFPINKMERESCNDPDSKEVI